MVIVAAVLLIAMLPLHGGDGCRPRAWRTSAFKANTRKRTAILGNCWDRTRHTAARRRLTHAVSSTTPGDAAARRLRCPPPRDPRRPW
jgi:hypothetical protein